MKNLVVAVVLVLLGILLIGPWWIGNQVEDALTEQYAVEPNPWFQSEVSEFEKGWFSSTARVSMSFTEQYRETMESALGAGEHPEMVTEMYDAIDDKIYSDLKITHGPVMLVDGLSFGFMHIAGDLDVSESKWLSELQSEMGIDSLATFSSLTDFGGTSHLAGEVPSFNEEDGGGVFKFDGCTMGGTAEFDQQLFDVSGLCPGITMTTTDQSGEPFEMSFGPMNFDVDGQQVSPTMMLGDMSFTVDHMNIAAEGQAMNAKAMSMSQTTTTDDKGLYNITANYSVGSIEGFDMNMSDMVFGVRMDGISESVFEGYMTLQSDMMNAIGEDGTQSEEMSEEMQTKIISLAHEYVSNSPTFALDPLKMTIDGSTLAADLEVRVDGSIVPAASAFDPMDIGMWMQAVSATANAELPREFALQIAENQVREQIAAMAAQNPDQAFTEEQIEQIVAQQTPGVLQMFEQQGMVVATETGYKTNAEFAGGVLKVNGVEVPLPM